MTAYLSEKFRSKRIGWQAFCHVVKLLRLSFDIGFNVNREKDACEILSPRVESLKFN